MYCVMRPFVYIFFSPGFRAWGHEMNMDTTPIETGLMPFVRMKKKVNTVGRA